MTRRLNKFARDDRGVTAIEFAILAPLVITIYFAMTQLVVAVSAERRASHAASAIADLVAQNATMTKDQLNAIMRIGPSIMDPFPAATPDPLKMRLSSVVVNTQGVAEVRWSRGDGMTALGKNVSPAGFPTELAKPGDAFVLGEVQYDLPLLIAPKLMKADVWSFKREFYLRPRRGAEVACTDCG